MAKIKLSSMESPRFARWLRKMGHAVEHDPRDPHPEDPSMIYGRFTDTSEDARKSLEKLRREFLASERGRV